MLNEVLVNWIFVGTRRADAKPSPLDNILIDGDDEFDELFAGGTTNLTNFVDEFVWTFPSTCWMMTLLFSAARTDFLLRSGVVTMVIAADGTTTAFGLP